ncbi:Oxidase ustYa [Cladobotryum mycophilum]|uniref:Oxidase ustYa n=1 Tax=Cladobotryum mycophilum TaxID=491253 RepID=A0ABR0SPX8_9HYPO
MASSYEYLLLHGKNPQRQCLNHSRVKWLLLAMLLAMFPLAYTLWNSKHYVSGLFKQQNSGLPTDVLFGDIPWVPVKMENDQRYIDAEPEARHPNGTRIYSIWDDIYAGTFVAFDDPSIGGAQGGGMQMTDVAADPSKWSAKSEGFAVAVMHQLHCVISIKQALVAFQKGHTGSHHTSDFEHLNHCVEMLRQAVMCQGDLSLERPHNADGTQGSTGWGSVHMCRDWSGIYRAVMANRIARSPDGKGWVDLSKKIN